MRAAAWEGRREPGRHHSPWPPPTRRAASVTWYTALGAAQSRLEATINNLQIARENMQNTQSVISDVDVAEESSEMAKLTIRQQAGTALLAQANIQPRMVLDLLRD